MLLVEEHLEQEVLLLIKMFQVKIIEFYFEGSHLLGDDVREDHEIFRRFNRTSFHLFKY
jgi:hypothetical protein